MKIILAVTCILLSPYLSLANSRCEALFAGHSLETTLNELARLKLKVESAKISGEDSISMTALKYDLTSKELEVMQSLGWSESTLRIEIKKHIANMQQSQEQSEKKKSEERKKEKEMLYEGLHPDNLMHQKMSFNPVRHGSFLMGVKTELNNHQMDVMLTEDFDMMSTPVTQGMWAAVQLHGKETDINVIIPSRHKQGPFSTTAVILGQEVNLSTENPVESITWQQIEDFLAILNRTSQSDKAEDQAFMRWLIPDHRKGDVYDLPTEAQWEFVGKNRGQFDGNYFNSEYYIDRNETAKYAWSAENSGNTTHPVAQLLPRMVDGRPFYDLQGNVAEITKTWIKESGPPSTATGPLVNPQGPATGIAKVAKGGGYTSDYSGSLSLTMTGTYRAHATSYSDIFGIRLIRMRAGN